MGDLAQRFRSRPRYSRRAGNQRRPDAVALRGASNTAVSTIGWLARTSGRCSKMWSNCCNLPEEVDREFLLRVLVAREEFSSTGIGEGIAIPHVRNPVVLHISKPMVTLFFLEHPIDFGAIDGQPVFALFMLISPTVRAHLHLISRLAYLASRPGVSRRYRTPRATRGDISKPCKKLKRRWRMVPPRRRRPSRQ